ncbi:4-hydroxythreonine-4-phosphate dehydrogenase PdxA [Streptomyces sp. AC512_CC834]|uniref:4-hydroxythreonine-4-phosphate dehydrogenase PdxA n=1 Tax=Streptomyces sp. AC512_CC834 TaxID=2823691 RepID=UPI0027E548DF|nr:4-hydroxythreonine-4-phosphate dehydrogenase PdxA [Streptomyces sp. AC512_CC834]
MCRRDDTSVVALADDLSGAAEVAALLRLPARLTLHAADLVAPAAGESVVVDLDSRHLDEDAAADAVRTALAGSDAGTGTPGASDPDEAAFRAFRAANFRAANFRAEHGRTLPPFPTVWYKKCDSLLRGPVGAEAVAFAEGAEFVVIATALPAAGRVVRDGVVLVDGVPLHESAAWRAETRAAPRSVAEALAPLPTEVVPAGVVRQGPVALAGRFRRAAERGRHPVCDAETDADLAVIAAAAALLGPGCRLLGSGGLAAALGRRISARAVGTARAVGASAPGSGSAVGAGFFEERGACPTARPLLFVAGSAEPVVAEQVARLVAAGARHLRLSPSELAGQAPVALPEPSPGTVTVLCVDGSEGVRPEAARRIAAGLARTVAALPGRPDLVLTGGETARRVLDAVGVTALWPVGEIHHGAVHCRTSDGRSVVTRPGSFGGPDSFHRIAAALRPRLLSPPLPPPLSPSSPPVAGPVRRGTLPARSHPVNAQQPLPLIGLTMGDGAGVGPEVIVPAALDATTLSRCRPVVIGDAARLRKAAEILGADCEIVAVATPADAEFTPGRINVIDLGLLPADLPWGVLSAQAGDAAYEYVKRAAELALEGEIDGICTAPLNKEALHAAGHLYPGHTELLAHFTGVEEVSMMLSTEKVKVIHVTTHIGLIDAVNRIEPGLVERTVRRGHEALVRTGLAAPVIGVCGINPHAGENGLFGYGEEAEKIVPALEKVRGDGIDARGPLPADTAFFLAARGDYDLIVAMYHDQGHGPVKVLGIEAGVNLTVGLPVIRTSVDHGTAFDIAGTGKAEAGSMVEALRQAAEMSTAR